MIGTWIVAIGRRLTREDTFERILSPAIADMQYEVERGLPRWRHVFGLASVLLYALVLDFLRDFQIAFRSDTRRFVWRRAGLWYAGCVVLLTWLGFAYNVPWDLVRRDVWLDAFLLALIEGLVSAAAPCITAAAVYLYRNMPTRRTITAVFIVASAATVALSLATIPLKISAQQSIHASVAAGVGNPPGSAAWLKRHAPELDEQYLRLRSIQAGVGLISFALMGVVLGRRRGWGVVRTVFGFYLTWLIIVWLMNVTLPLFVREAFRFVSPAGQYWRQIVLTTTAVLVWLAADALRGRQRRVPLPETEDAMSRETF